MNDGGRDDASTCRLHGVELRPPPGSGQHVDDRQAALCEGYTGRERVELPVWPFVAAAGCTGFEGDYTSPALSS